MSEHELWNELGNLYFMSGTYHQAAYAYRRAIQLDGGFGRPYCNLALTYVKQGRFDEAVQLYQRSIELLADDTERAITWYRLGDVYRHLKDYRDAILAYQQADMLDGGLSADEKETHQILYGGAEVRLVHAGAVSPAIPETVSAAPAPQPEPEAPAAAADEQTPAAPEAATPVDEQPQAAMTESPAEAAPVAVQEAQDIPSPVAKEVDEATAIVESPEAILEAAEAASEPGSAEEIISLELPLGPVAEDLDVLLHIDEVEAQLGIQAGQAADEQPSALENEAALSETPAPVTEEIEPQVEAPTAEMQAGLESDEVLAAVEPDVELPVQEPISEPETQTAPEGEDIPAVVEAQAEGPLPEAQDIAIDEETPLDTAPVDEPVTDLAASSAADWEEYVVSSMEQETDVQGFEEATQPLDEWLPAVEMELPAAQPEEALEEPVAIDEELPAEEFAAVEPVQPVEEAIAIDEEPATDDVPTAEVPYSVPSFPESAVQGLRLEEMQAPSVALDFRKDETQPIFIVPEEMEQGFSVVQVESGTTDVAFAAEAEEMDAELQSVQAEIEKFRFAVQANPRNAPAWDTLGTLYKAARQYQDAIMAYQQAVSVDPSKPHYHHHLGILYAIEGREEDAVKAFQDVLDLDPNHSLANATLGGYYRKMGLEDLAQKHIGKAMKNFYTSENEYNRACLEALLGNTDQSLELLRIALKNKQTYVDWVLRDPDLDSIRRDPRFKQLISDYATW